MPAVGGNQCGLLTLDVDDITDADVAGWVVAVTNEAMPDTIAPPAMTVLAPVANRAGGATTGCLRYAAVALPCLYCRYAAGLASHTTTATAIWPGKMRLSRLRLGMDFFVIENWT